MHGLLMPVESGSGFLSLEWLFRGDAGRLRSAIRYRVCDGDRWLGKPAILQHSTATGTQRLCMPVQCEFGFVTRELVFSVCTGDLLRI